MNKTLLFLCLTMFLLSCEKNNQDELSTETASSTGIIVPVGVAAGISLRYDDSTRFIPLTLIPQQAKLNWKTSVRANIYCSSILPEITATTLL